MADHGDYQDSLAVELPSHMVTALTDQRRNLFTEVIILH